MISIMPSVLGVLVLRFCQQMAAWPVKLQSSKFFSSFGSKFGSSLVMLFHLIIDPSDLTWMAPRSGSVFISPCPIFTPSIVNFVATLPVALFEWRGSFASGLGSTSRKEKSSRANIGGGVSLGEPFWASNKSSRISWALVGSTSSS